MARSFFRSPGSVGSRRGNLAHPGTVTCSAGRQELPCPILLYPSQVPLPCIHYASSLTRSRRLHISASTCGYHRFRTLAQNETPPHFVVLTALPAAVVLPCFIIENLVFHGTRRHCPESG